MKRQWKIILCLVLVLAALSGCSDSGNSPQVYEEVTQYIGPSATNTPKPAQNNPSQQNEGSIFANNPYNMDGDGFTPEDALGEEDYFEAEDSGDVYDQPGSIFLGQGMDAGATRYPYAGSTPIPLDPVDMPPPTARAPLVFAFVPYNISSLGLTFEGPAGWYPDESVTEQFTLSEPENQVKDNQQCVIKINASLVNSNYSETNLKTEVLERLKTISATNFEVWSPSLTATRHLMGGKGVYANYSGTLANGVKVGGRVHFTCIDKVLYSIEIVFPLAYKEDYLEVFSQMRLTVKIAK